MLLHLFCFTPSLPLLDRDRGETKLSDEITNYIFAGWWRPFSLPVFRALVVLFFVSISLKLTMEVAVQQPSSRTFAYTLTLFFVCWCSSICSSPTRSVRRVCVCVCVCACVYVSAPPAQVLVPGTPGSSVASPRPIPSSPLYPRWICSQRTVLGEKRDLGNSATTYRPTDGGFGQ